MPDVISGVVHGKTIELRDDPGVADGAEVDVILLARRVPTQSATEGRSTAAGMLADYPDSDEALAEILRERKAARYREWPE